MLVRGVVNRDRVDRQVPWRFRVDLFQKPRPFYVRVVGVGPGDELTFQIIQGGEQRNDAVTFVVVGPGANMANPADSD